MRNTASSTTSSGTARALKIEGYLYLTAYIACIPLANWMVMNVGTVCPPDSPCLVPVWPGIMSPSGILIVGIAFTLRDLVQRRLGASHAIIAVMVGALLSGAVSPRDLALASAVAFLISESIDFVVYTALYRRSFLIAVCMSNMVGLVIDSFVFLQIAFGSVGFVAGQAMGKLWMTLLAIPFILVVRELDRRRGLPV